MLVSNITTTIIIVTSSITILITIIIVTITNLTTTIIVTSSTLITILITIISGGINDGNADGIGLGAQTGFGFSQNAQGGLDATAQLGGNVQVR